MYSLYEEKNAEVAIPHIMVSNITQIYMKFLVPNIIPVLITIKKSSRHMWYKFFFKVALSTSEGTVALCI